MAGRIPNERHRARPWRIHEVVPDFRLEDVWELPGEGGEGDFPRLVALIASMDPAQGSSRVAGALWALRWKIGDVLGWDREDAGLDTRVESLQERLPADLQAAPRGPAFAALPFEPLFELADEWAAEIANRTMHGVMHLGAVPVGDGRFRAELAVYVRPNGLFGRAYMAAIRPFRHLVVYPPMLRDGERAWHRARGAS